MHKFISYIRWFAEIYAFRKALEINEEIDNK